MVPEPPEELQGADIAVEYTSVLHQAMKMAGLQGVQQLAGYVTSLAPAFPDVLDAFNADASVDEMATMLGASPKLINDAETRRRIRDGRAQEQAQQMAMAQAQQAAQTAQTLSQTNTTDQNALTQMSQWLQGA